jgi:hypothetical protein
MLDLALERAVSKLPVLYSSAFRLGRGIVEASVRPGNVATHGMDLRVK